MYTVDNCPHVGCGDCKFFNGTDFHAPAKSTCKRIDHMSVRFVRPLFNTTEYGKWHIPCRDFVPKHPEYAHFKDWTCFEDFWPVYVKAWLPYENEGITVDFTLNGDDKVRYHVPLKLFMDGTMIHRGVLRAVKRSYYKRGRVDRGIQLYQLVNEPIGGVKIRTGKCINRRHSA